MSIFEITADALRPLTPTVFGIEGVKERADLQRLLRTNIDIISAGSLVVAEEFGEWDESRRRIDLLAIDKEANLIVIELKRTEDGGHMELQAIRYAAMVAAMTFDQLVDIYDRNLRRLSQEGDARAMLLSFLDWEDAADNRFPNDVRIILASAEFSRELTTAVMWLNERDLDIRCVRLKPYTLDGKILIDAQQIIPLPEVAEYQVQIRDKEQRERRVRRERHVLRRRFWEGLLERSRARTPLHAGISPGEHHWIGTGSGMRGLGLNYVIWEERCAVELYIDRGANAKEENKYLYDALLKDSSSIEQVFAGELEWQRLDTRQACRIRHSIDIGGYRSSEDRWPSIQDAMVDAMIRLEHSVAPHIVRLKSLV